MAGGGRDRVQARARALLVALFWQTRACPRPPPSRQVPPFMMGQERLRPRGEATKGFGDAQQVGTQLGQLAPALLPAVGEQIGDLGGKPRRRTQIAGRTQVYYVGKQGCGQGLRPTRHPLRPAGPVPQRFPGAG